jgi:hypothetical protein
LRHGIQERQVEKQHLAVLLAVGLMVAVTGCVAGEPERAEATGEANVPRDGDVTREVSKVVERPARGTAEATGPVGVIPSASPATTSRPDSTAAPSPSLAIESFTAEADALSDGQRRVTFTWKTMGASLVSIRFVTRPRFFPCWGNLPASGTQVFEGDAIYPNPDARLMARDAAGNWVHEELEVDWPCRYPYFFTADTETDCPIPTQRTCSCPRHAAIITQAVEQPFENGRMLWLQGTASELVYPDTIVVLYEDTAYKGYTHLHQAAFFKDTWTADEPDRDPALTPPTGRFQPICGFGKLWRENATVRERIGWATAPEQRFEGAWQSLESETLGGRDVFLRIRDGRVVLFSGYWMSGGSWTFVTSSCDRDLSAEIRRGTEMDGEGSSDPLEAVHDRRPSDAMADRRWAVWLSEN